MGNFPIWPMVGCPDDDINKCPIRERVAPYDSKTLQATPGYFTVTLANGIKAEMTTSNKTAIYRFTFPAPLNATDIANFGPAFSIELSDLPNTRKQGGIAVDYKSGRMKGEFF